MAINSRKKGSKTERLVAKLIEDWTGKKFARTPSSGGLQWKASMAKGDVVCTTEGHFFPFCLEVKNYRNINFEHLLYNPKGSDILKFWEQASRDATLAKKVPMLLMRYNGLPRNLFFIVIPTNFISGAVKHNLKLDGILLNYQAKELNLTICKSTDFFNIPYSQLRKYTKQWLKRKK